MKNNTPLLGTLDSNLLLKTLDSLSSPVLVAKNEEGVLKTQYLNRAFTEIIGYTLEEIPDIKSWYKLVFPRAIYRVAIKSEWFKAMENAMSAGENTISNIARICLKNGDYNWFDLRTTIDNEMHFIVFLDINKVNEENQKLRNELMIKNNVLSILSHDLRNPFSSIKALADLLETENRGNYFENIKEYTHLIKKTASSALVMLEELLLSARMEVQEMAITLQKTDIRKLITDIVEKFRLDIAYKSQVIDLLISVEEPIVLDNMKTEQIITNLFSNAVKYTDYGKKITVGATLADEILTVWVEDEGLGFDEKDRQKMFGKFQILSARPTGGEKSVGLGLYICKTFAEQQNGKIIAESKGKNQGSKFILQIPIKEVDAEEV